MKKLLPFLFLLLLAIVGLAIFKQISSPVSTPVADALPRDTVVFLQIPDIHGTSSRFQNTAIARIFQEPEVQAFLDQPGNALKELFPAGTIHPLARLQALKVSSAFVALTSLDVKNLSAIAGFSHATTKEEILKQIEPLKETFFESNPAATAELLSHNGIEIQVFNADPREFAIAFASEAFYITTSVDFLKSFLDRLDTPDKENSLTQNPLFVKATDKLPSSREFMAYANLEIIFDALEKLTALSPESFDPDAFEQIKPMKAFVASVSIEQDIFRDVTFVLTDKQLEYPELREDSLKFTSPDSLIYAASLLHTEDMNLDDPNLQALIISNPYFAAIQEALNEKGMDITQMEDILGDEASFILDWPAAATSPNPLISVQLRSQQIANNISTLLLSGEIFDTLTPETLDNASLFLFPQASILPIRASLALSENYLFFSLSPEQLRQSFKTTDSPTLESSEKFKKAKALVPAANMSFIYLDAQMLFERLYGTLRPFILIGASFAPDINKYIDPAKLPATETISKHLSPIATSISNLPEGVYTESAGPVTFNQLTAVNAGLIGLAVVTYMQNESAISSLPFFPALPSATGTPTDAPEPTSTPAKTPESTQETPSEPAPEATPTPEP